MDYSKYTVAIKKGDREAFRSYMNGTMDSVFRMICRIVASEDDARDIVQETYIKLWEKRRSIKSDKSLFSFTGRIALNRAYDFLRARKRRGEWENAVDISELRNLASSQNAEDVINANEYSMIMKSLSSGLSAKQQLVYTLSEIEKLSADEIAGLTGLSKTSIKSNLYHARKEVRKNAEKIL